MTDANYAIAIKTLDERFGNKQKIIMDSLLSIRSVTENNLRGVRDVYDKVTSHLRSLQALKVDSEMYGNPADSNLNE